MVNALAETTKTIDIIDNGLDWHFFFSNYWLKKPVLIKRSFRNPVMTKTEIFEILKRYQADLALSKKRQLIIYDRFRSCINGYHTSQRNNLGVHKLLPSSEDSDFDEFYSKLISKDQYREFCIYIEDANSDQLVWNKMRDLLHSLYNHIPLSPHQVTCDLFIGNYSKTNFGAHRDPLDNMMFMVFGKRTMLLWDDKTWFEELGNPRNYKHVVIDYEHFRSSAISVEVEEGDMLYWPASTWHVGENNGELSASFNVDFFSEEMDNDIFSDHILKKGLHDVLKLAAIEVFQKNGKIVEEYVKSETKISLPESYHQRFKDFVNKLSEKSYDTELTSWWLKKNTSFGQLIPSAKQVGEIEDTTPLYLDSRYPVLYSLIDHNLLISHSGHVLFISSHAEIFVSVLDKLNQQDHFSAKSLFESLEFSAINQEAVLNLIQQLFAIGAVTIQS